VTQLIILGYIHYGMPENNKLKYTQSYSNGVAKQITFLFFEWA